MFLFKHYPGLRTSLIIRIFHIAIRFPIVSAGNFPSRYPSIIIPNDNRTMVVLTKHNGIRTTNFL